MPIERYRPSLTAGQISSIIKVFKSTYALSVIGVADIQDVLATFVPFEAKITNKIKQPVSSVETLGEKLGWENGMILTPEEKRANAYAKWQQDPMSCNLDELNLAQDFRYTHNLMTKEQREEYEQRIFACNSSNL